VLGQDVNQLAQILPGLSKILTDLDSNTVSSEQQDLREWAAEAFVSSVQVY
jgi:hypothetical protein